jgi:2-iminobutanoate/2-iminopropanoate deaminase
MKNGLFILCLSLISLALNAQEKEMPKPVAPYSPGVMTSEGLLFISGQIPIDSESGKVLKGNIALETRLVMERIGAVLEKHGLEYTDLVKCTVFLTDIRDYKAMNEEYAKYFDGSFPAREAIEVSNLPLGASIEISGIASKR